MSKKFKQIIINNQSGLNLGRYHIDLIINDVEDALTNYSDVSPFCEFMDKTMTKRIYEDGTIARTNFNKGILTINFLRNK